jgi:hypothetical protein
VTWPLDNLSHDERGRSRADVRGNGFTDTKPYWDRGARKSLESMAHRLDQAGCVAFSIAFQ